MATFGTVRISLELFLDINVTPCSHLLTRTGPDDDLNDGLNPECRAQAFAFPRLRWVCRLLRFLEDCQCSYLSRNCLLGQPTDQSALDKLVAPASLRLSASSHGWRSAGSGSGCYRSWGWRAAWTLGCWGLFVRATKYRLPVTWPGVNGPPGKPRAIDYYAAALPAVQQGADSPLSRRSHQEEVVARVFRRSLGRTQHRKLQLYCWSKAALAGK